MPNVHSNFYGSISNDGAAQIRDRKVSWEKFLSPYLQISPTFHSEARRNPRETKRQCCKFPVLTPRFSFRWLECYGLDSGRQALKG